MRAKLTIAYNGTNFLGSQIQKSSANTINGNIENLLKKLNIDTSISKSESMADANTATDPLATPMTSFTNTKIEATVLETNVARFCGDILFPYFRSF